ncbi:MAG: nitroreductase family deazaflavin-dependent oxidoreductase [Anaerolineae bacterium]|nr:nitroreductase family deazaflavin-dependent oxidoreductase [Anaerolineae bacterium]
MSLSHEQPGFNLRKTIFRFMNRRVTALYGRMNAMSQRVLILTTRGRKSGLLRQTPLQYEFVECCYIVAAGYGKHSDWYLNACANPQVEIRIGKKRFSAVAEAVETPERIADFFALRLKRHPFIVGLIMRLDGLPLFYSRDDLLDFASGKAMLVIRPEA